MQRINIIFFVYFILIQLCFANVPDKPSSSAVGWGNLIVPGLGATLRDRPTAGLLEASIELGTFYGGSLLIDESRFKIDGTASLPQKGSVGKHVTAQILQQVGLKYHFYNTFYHYQQASFDNIETSDYEKHKEALQPIYRGDWKDMATAPFQWENLSSPWSWPILVGVGSFLMIDYKNAKVFPSSLNLNKNDQRLLLAYNSTVMPFGSSFGEDVLFRGFMQREIHGATNSLPLAMVSQSAMFAALHDGYITAFAVGMYFGYETHALKGNLGPVMATHFWLDVLLGMIDYWTIRRSSGLDAPFNPPISTSFVIPF